jgi:hypothetical protein
MKLAHLILLAMLALLCACGGGGDDDGTGSTGGGGTGAAGLQQEYRMWKCTIYRRTEGFTGFQYWSSCPNSNWRLKANQPVFTSLSACEDAIGVLKNSDSVIYNNSTEDRMRGYAVKLLCFEPDTTAPTVLSVTPTDGSSDFAIDGSRVRVDFSDNMLGSTITTSSFTLEDAAGTLIAGTVVYGYEQRAAVFESIDPLDHDATYTARLTTDITDKVGNPLAEPYVWSFTTRGVPQPPADTSTPLLTVNFPHADSVCVAEKGTITARFSESIAVADGAFTVEDSTGTLVDGTVTVSNTVASFRSTLALSSNEVYTARLTGALTDLAGNALTPTDWSFRTQLAPEGTWVPIATPETFGPRTGHRAVWTGSEMIVWGGINWQDPTFPWKLTPNEGARYDPAADQWVSISRLNAPRGRTQHTATWTGSEMIIWGGSFGGGATDTGARYYPATDTWTTMSTIDAPQIRANHTAIWTGSELIIWGGTGKNDGARYDPLTDAWSPLSSINAPAVLDGHTAVFDSQRMIILSATGTDGAQYDPVSDVWTPLPSQNAPGGDGPYRAASVVSTGTDMLVLLPKKDWNYDQYADDWYSEWVSETRRFNYQDQEWLNVVDGCNPQATPYAVWVDKRMLSWNVNYSLGQTYSSELDNWAPLPPYPDWFGGGATVLVAGDEVIIWGGRNVYSGGTRDIATNLGYRLVF